MKKLVIILFLIVCALGLTTSKGFADTNGYNFPSIIPPASTYQYTYTNVNSTAVGVIGMATSGITWVSASSPSCSTSHIYDNGHNPAVEGCNVQQNATITITLTPTSTINNQPNDLGYVTQAYDTNSGFGSGQYNTVGNGGSGTMSWNVTPTPTPMATVNSTSRGAVTNLLGSIVTALKAMIPVALPIVAVLVVSISAIFFLWKMARHFLGV